MREEVQYDVEEWQGEWIIVKQCNTRKEAEEERRFREHHEGKKLRVVKRTYRVLWEASK